MQKNGFLMRFISCTLALAMLFGMVPMGVVRVNAAENAYEWIKISDSRTTHVTLSEAELKCGTSTSQMVENLLLVTAQTPARALAITDDGQLTTVLLNDIVKTADGDVISAKDGYSITKWSVEYTSYNQNDSYLWVQQVSASANGNTYYLDIDQYSENKITLQKEMPTVNTLQCQVQSGGSVYLSDNNDNNSALCVNNDGTVSYDQTKTPIYFYKLKGQSPAVYAQISYPTVATVQGVQPMAMDQFLAAVSEYCEILFSNDGGATVAKSLPLNESGIGYHIFGPKGSNITEVTDNSAIVEEGEYVIEIDTPNGEELGEITVNVELADKPTVDLDIETNSVLIYMDEGSKDIQLTPKITAGFEMPPYTYEVTSSDMEVATASVDNNVLTVQAVSKGTATVTVELVPGNDTVFAGSVEKTVTVQVESRPLELTVKPTGLVMQKETQKALSNMVTAAVTVNGTPVEAGSYNLTWTIPESDAAVATLTGGTVNAIGKGTASLTATLTYILDGETKTEEKTVTIVVTESAPTEGDWKNVYAGDYEYSRLTYDQLASNLGEILMVYGQTPPDANGVCTGVVITTEDGSIQYVPVTIKQKPNGMYEVTSTGNSTISHWTMGTGYTFKRTINGKSFGFFPWSPFVGENSSRDFSAEEGSASSSICFYHEGYLSWTGSGLDRVYGGKNATCDAYIYKPTAIVGTAVDAMLYAADTYSFDVTEYYDGLLQDVLGQTQIWVDTNDDGVADETYFLNETLPEGYSWELYKGSEKVDQITSTGEYTVQAYYTDRNDNTKKLLGDFNINIEVPTVAFTITTDGTMSNGSLSVGTGKSANVTPTVTVTLSDGTQVEKELINALISVKDEEGESKDYIALGATEITGVMEVTGKKAGSEKITAEMSELWINGLEILQGTSKTAELNVSVFQMNYVNLNIAEIPGAVTVDAQDEDKKSVTIDLSYLTDPENYYLNGATVSYTATAEDPEGTGVQCKIEGNQLIIYDAEAKGTATVTVTLVLTENPDKADLETGTVTERQITVNVTHNALEPYEITVSPVSVLVGAGNTKALQPVVTQGTSVVNNPQITWTTNNSTVATVDENGVVTGVAVGTATITATVSYTLNGESKTATCQVPVKVAGTEDLYEIVVIPDELAMDVGEERDLTAIVTYEGDMIAPDIKWSVTGDCVTVDDDGTVRAIGFGTASVKASAVVGKDKDGNDIVKEISVPITITEPELELGQNFKVSQGSVITVTPYVNLKNEFSSYEVTWQVTSGDGVVTLGGTTTVGGPQAANASGIQYIKDALNSITASTSATGTATVEAWLSKLNGVEVSGEHDSITVEVVPTALNLKNEYLVNHNSALTTLDPNSSYQFLLKDAHTFQEIVNAGTSDEITDVNGLDARVTAVVGDNHIDFSNVTAYVYKDGQIVLDDSGKPIVIPASDLIFYNVETDEVGWHEVRVTYKDYYYTHLDQTLDDGSISKVPVYKYEEYEVGTVWMYVREPVSVTESMTAYIVHDTYYEKNVELDYKQKYLIVDENKTLFIGWESMGNVGVSPDGSIINEITMPDVHLRVETVEWCFVPCGEGKYLIQGTNSKREKAYLTTSSTSQNGLTTDIGIASAFSVLKNSDGTYTIVSSDNKYLGMYEGKYAFSDTEGTVELYQKVIDADLTPVKVNVTDIRPWVGAGTSSFVENSAHLTPLAPESDGNVFPYYFDVSFTFNYNGKTYSFSDACDYITHETVGGNLIATWKGTVSGALEDYSGGNRFSALAASKLESFPAMGYVDIVLTEVKVDGLTVELAAPLTIQVPIVVREDTVKIDRVTTFGCNDKAGGRWGGTQSYGFKYWLGGGPTSAYFSGYAMEYVSDLVEGRFDVGINDFGKTSGTWHEYLTVNAPLGTGNVISYLHSITESDGTVLILDEGDRTLDTADYAINVDPEMIILKEHGSSLQYPTEGTVQATITDDKGNRITTDAKVKWIMRNSSISDVVGQQLTYPKGDPLDGYFNEEVPADANGRTDTYTVTSVNSGVTYITAQLMEVKVDGEWVDVSGYYIADYCIIYVVDDDEELESVDIVFDYGKPIEIDYDKLSYTKQITDENGNVVETIEYEFAGFADTEHPMRKHAYTTYGEIEYFDGTDPDVIYTPLDIVDSVETVYAILQVKGTNNQWVFHKIHIIPATVVYYETDGNVAPAYDYTGSWATTGSYKEGLQDDYRSESNGGKEIYGYDSSYDDDAHLSNESSLFVHGMSTAGGVVSGDPETSASFSFTGTGFDIIARTNMNQATLRVHVVNQETKAKKIVSVICKGTNELYQIPVISVKGLDYGTYDVEIIVYEAYDPRKVLDEDTQKVFGETTLDRLTRGDEFHFDAIRIYDPVKGDATAEAAYKSDGEYAQTITQIGQLLIDQQKFQETTESSVAIGAGAVFMDSYLLDGDTDGDGFVQTSVVGTYDAVGPNNEVYLGQNQGIAFILDTEGTIPVSIQIGAKSITGDSVKLNAKLVSASQSITEGTKYTETDPDLSRPITTSTAMYYELSNKTELASLFADGNQVYVVIWNDQNSVLSITDIKFAYDEAAPGSAKLLYNAELAKVAATLISGSQEQTYLQKIGDDWCYCDSNGQVIKETGLVQTSDSGTWYVVDGKVNFAFSGLYTDKDGGQYAVRSGRVETELNGIANRGDQWLYFTNGKVDTTFTGPAEYNGVEYTVEYGIVKNDPSVNN